MTSVIPHLLPHVSMLLCLRFTYHPSIVWLSCFLILYSRGAVSWWGCSDSGPDSGLLIDSHSGSDAKYEINNTLIFERNSAVQAKKTKHEISYWLWLAFLRMEDLYHSYHSCLIFSSESVVAWWRSTESSHGGIPVPYAPYVLTSNACTVHLLRAHAVTITPTQAQLDPQLSNCISTWFTGQRAKNAARNGGNNGDQHGVVNTRCHCLCKI